MDASRREFIGSLAAAVALPSIGLAVEGGDWFEDLKVDRYYVLQGGIYGDTGGWGSPYPEMGIELLANLRDWDGCRVLEDRMDVVERRGFYLTPTQYHGKPFRFYDRIPLSKKWMKEFYRRHRDDTPDDWWKRYNDHYDALRASGWKVEDDRAS